MQTVAAALIAALSMGAVVTVDVVDNSGVRAGKHVSIEDGNGHPLATRTTTDAHGLAQLDVGRYRGRAYLKVIAGRPPFPHWRSIILPVRNNRIHWQHPSDDRSDATGNAQSYTIYEQRLVYDDVLGRYRCICVAVTYRCSKSEREVPEDRDDAPDEQREAAPQDTRNYSEPNRVGLVGDVSAPANMLRQIPRPGRSLESLAVSRLDDRTVQAPVPQRLRPGVDFPIEVPNSPSLDEISLSFRYQQPANSRAPDTLVAGKAR
jgi:hypothetical protein